jgi:hypothetical protein
MPHKLTTLLLFVQEEREDNDTRRTVVDGFLNYSEFKCTH